MHIRASPRSGLSRHAVGFTQQRQASSDINLHIILEGSICYRQGSQAIHAATGALVCLPIGQRFVQSDGLAEQGVTLAVVHASLKDQGHLPPWPNAIVVIADHHQAVQQQRIHLGWSLVTAAQAWRDGDPLAEPEVAGLAQALIAHCYRHNASRAAVDTAWAAPLLALIDQQLPNPAFSARDIIAATGLSRSHACRRFCAAVGHPPAQYLRRCRLRHAQHLLAHGASVQEAAQASGYDDPFHFSRAFKHRYGMAPSCWQTHQSSANQTAAAPSQF